MRRRRGRSSGCSRLFCRGPSPFRKNAGGWLVSGLVQCDSAGFSLSVAMCPFGMPLVDRVYA